MKKISKFLRALSTIALVINIVLLYLFVIITKNNYFNGYIVLIFLFMLYNPVLNIFRLNKKIITNFIYHLLVIIISGYTTYVSINSLIIYNKCLSGNDNSMSLNDSVNYFGERFIYIVIACLVILLSTFIFKKNKVKSNKDNTYLMLFIILILSIIPVLKGGGLNYITTSFNIALIIFVILTLFRLRRINTASDLQKYYLILMVTSLGALNPITFVISCNLFIQLDTFGINI